MKPDYLLLRGFEGILSGMGLSEIEIDFSVVPDGIVVFDGPNGRGKTTIVDNMHHFRVMPSKVNKSYSPEGFQLLRGDVRRRCLQDLRFHNEGHAP